MAQSWGEAVTDKNVYKLLGLIMRTLEELT